MTREDCGRWVRGLMRSGDLHEFYISPQWRRLRADVLREARYECADCRRRGWYTRATTVHHVRHVRQYPEYALSRTYEFQGRSFPNLLPLCASCHEAHHPERHARKHHADGHEVTPERW